MKESYRTSQKLNLLLPRNSSVKVLLSKESGVRLRLSPMILSRIFSKILNAFSRFPTNVELHLVRGVSMKALNKQYRRKESTTDVLSFSSRDPHLLGSIVVDVDTAKRQARAFDHSLQREVLDLFVHGCLHLLGLDHQTKKEAAQMSQYETYFGSLLTQLIGKK